MKLEHLQSALAAREREEQTFSRPRRRGLASREHMRYLMAWAAEDPERRNGPLDPEHWAHQALIEVRALVQAGALRARATRPSDDILMGLRTPSRWWVERPELR